MDKQEKKRLETNIQDAKQEYKNALVKVLYHLADYLADNKNVSDLIKSVAEEAIEDFIIEDKYQESDYFTDFESIGYFEDSYRLAQKKYNDFMEKQGIEK